MCIWQQRSVCFLKIIAVTFSLQTLEEMSSKNSPSILGINPFPLPHGSHRIVALIVRCAFLHCICIQFHSAITVLLHHLQIIIQLLKFLGDVNRRNLNSLQQATKILQEIKKHSKEIRKKQTPFNFFLFFFYYFF